MPTFPMSLFHNDLFLNKIKKRESSIALNNGP